MRNQNPECPDEQPATTNPDVAIDALIEAFERQLTATDEFSLPRNATLATALYGELQEHFGRSVDPSLFEPGRPGLLMAQVGTLIDEYRHPDAGLKFIKTISFKEQQ